MEIFGYIALAIMGVTLGIIGAGGSILTIPILVYLLKIPILLATSYSLIVVGSVALIATFRYRRHILFRNSLPFLIPSILGIFTARHFIITRLPNSLGTFSTDKALVVLLLIFMTLSGYFIIKDSSLDERNHPQKYKNIKIIMIGFFLGIIMGILGAGGGFLIIPTLVLLLGVSMQHAIATSLFIITINSFTGFTADQHHFMAVDWINLVKYLIPALLGMLIGLYVVKFINGKILNKAFGYFVWIVGIAIFMKEFIL